MLLCLGHDFRTYSGVFADAHTHPSRPISSVPLSSFRILRSFFLRLAQGYVIPVPEEIILLITGYIASTAVIHLTPAIFIVIIAFIIGDNILYRLTLKNNKHVTKLINEVLSIKFISKHKPWLEKHINTTIFFTRFVPFLRFVGPVFAGYTKTKEADIHDLQYARHRHLCTVRRLDRIFFP